MLRIASQDRGHGTLREGHGLGVCPALGCFEEGKPIHVVLEVLGGDPVEPSHPLLQASMEVVDILYVVYLFDHATSLADIHPHIVQRIRLRIGLEPRVGIGAEGHI